MLCYIRTKNKELILIYALVTLLAIFFVGIYILSHYNLQQYIFCCGLMVLSIYIFAKAFVFRSDSSLFLATLCFLFSVVLCVDIKFNFNILQWISVFCFCFAICHLNLFIFFDKIFNLFTFAFYFIIFLTLILYSFYCINLLIMLLLLGGDIVILISLFVCKKYG